MLSLPRGAGDPGLWEILHYHVSVSASPISLQLCLWERWCFLCASLRVAKVSRANPPEEEVEL